MKQSNIYTRIKRFAIPGMLVTLPLLALFRSKSDPSSRRVAVRRQQLATSGSGCPPGTFVVDGTTCADCAVNTVSAAFDSPNCTPCPTGLIPNEFRTDCVCPDGTEATTTTSSSSSFDNNGGLLSSVKSGQNPLCSPQQTDTDTDTETNSEESTPSTPEEEEKPAVSSEKNDSNCKGRDQQCGGTGYTGETCCKAGFTCEGNEWWASCEISPASEECATLDGQCGGENWDGPNCCIDGFKCIAQNQFFSSCLALDDPRTNVPTPSPTLAPVPSPNAICKGRNEQCGGNRTGYTGETCCKAGFTCVGDEWWASCQANPPSEGCATLHGQCGGRDWDGPTCCIDGFKCVAQNQFFSHCLELDDPRTSYPTPSPTVAPVPSPNATCKGRDQQCGGTGYTGETCCKAGFTCEGNEWWSSCQLKPASDECATLHGQCGGENWDGPNCCIDGFTCVAKNEFFWHCLQSPEPEGNSATPSPTDTPGGNSTTPTASPTAEAPAGGGNTPTQSPTEDSDARADSTPTPTEEPPTEEPVPSPTEEPVSSPGPGSGSTCKGRDEQCGGIGYMGATCCISGFECVEHNVGWSSCKADQTAGGCSILSEGCGGVNWNGPTCCVDGLTCVEQSKYFSQCLDVEP